MSRSERIEEARRLRARGLLQRQIAALLGVTQPTVSGWLSGMAYRPISPEISAHLIGMALDNSVPFVPRPWTLGDKGDPVAPTGHSGLGAGDISLDAHWLGGGLKFYERVADPSSRDPLDVVLEMEEAGELVV